MKSGAFSRSVAAVFTLLWLGVTLFSSPVFAARSAALATIFSRAYYLNPNTGRFWTMDSYAGSNSDPLTLHKYVYCHDNPIDGTDPTGLWREISSNFMGGKDAEEPVVADFIAKRGVANAATLKSVHGILNYASKTGYRGLGRLVPDMVDFSVYEIYDVKSWNEMLDGMIKIQSYVWAFNQADPDPLKATKWHAGLKYNYGGANPYLMPRTSNGKQVWAVYFPTQGGVVPYKLYEVDNDDDRKRIPFPIFEPVRARKPALERTIYTAPIGAMVYTSYYTHNAVQNLAIVGTAGLLTYVGMATLNSMQGAP